MDDTKIKCLSEKFMSTKALKLNYGEHKETCTLGREKI